MPTLIVIHDKIDYKALPHAALKAFSLRQRTYIDEFDFYRTGHMIEAYYAGERLAVWDGQNWLNPNDH